MLDAMSVLVALRDILKPTDPSILPFLLQTLKYLFVLLLLINCRSLPFNWHIRVFRPVFYMRLKWWSMLGRSNKKEEWLESLSPVGLNPLDMTTSFKTWASPDESDLNLHLSNSSYAKNLDAARLKMGMGAFAMFYRDGGWMALGATHYNFVKEIPLFTSYDIRLCIISWDEKWLYLGARYVSIPKKHAPAKAQTAGVKAAMQTTSTSDAYESDVSIPSLYAPASADPTPSAAPITSSPVMPVESSDVTLHCIAVSQMCFKVGRITVPPAVALASSGFCLTAPEWKHVRGMRQRGEMRAFLRGGWRDVPVGARWWENALERIEERRVRNLQVVGKVREGLEGVRAL